MTRHAILRWTALPEISDWFTGTARFMLVTGGMGTGKTTLTKQLPGYLAPQSWAVHHCRSDDATTISVNGLLSSWSTQLLHHLKRYDRHLAQQWRTTIQGTAQGPGSVGVRITNLNLHVDEPPADVLTRVIAAPLRELARRNRLPVVLLVVDGVEEATDADGRNRVFDLLASLSGVSLPPEVRFLVTSRPDPALAQALSGAHHLDLDGVSEQDVVNYVVARAANDPALVGRSRVPGGLPRFARLLTEHVKGNFLVAARVLDDLAGTREPYTESSLRATPSTMPQLFRERLRHLFDYLDERQRDLLGLLAVARAPLRAEEIADLLGATDGWVRRCLTRLRPVLGLDSGRYRLFHRCLADFLHDSEENQLWWRSASEDNLALANRISAQWARDWAACDHPYALNHVVAHFTSAITGLRGGRRQDAQRQLTEILLDSGFLQARTTSSGVDGLYADLGYAQSVLPGPEVGALARSLLRQAHHLRKHPELVARQLHHDAVLTGDAALAGRLDPPGLRLAWASSPAAVPALHTLSGHSGAITAVAAGSHVVTGSVDGTVRVWDGETGALRHVLSGHEGPISSVVLADRVLSGSADGTVRAWDLRTGELELVVEGHEGPVTGVAVAGTRIVSASWDRTVRVWDGRTGAPLRVLRGHQGQVDALAVADQTAVTAGGDGTIRLWHLNSGRQLHSHTGQSAQIRLLAASATRVVLGAGDGTVCVIDPRSGLVTGTLDGKAGRVTAMSLAGKLITGTSDGTVRVWDLDTGQSTARLHTGGRVTAVALSADGHSAVTAAEDGTARVWNLSAMGESTADRHSGQINAVAVTGQGRAITASDDKSVRIWDTRTGELLNTLEEHQDWVTSVAVSTDGDRAATASYDRTARVWDVRTGEQLHELVGHEDQLTAVALTRDGTKAVTASWDRTARVWDLHTGNPLWTLRGHLDWITAVAVTPGGDRTVTVSDDGAACVWDLRTGSLYVTLSGHWDKVAAVAVTDALAVTGSWDATARVWSVEGGHLVHVLAGHQGAVTCVAVDPSGARAATGSADGTAALWDLASGRCLFTTEKHDRRITAVAVTPDGAEVVTASEDQTIRVSGPDRSLLVGQPEPATCLALTETGFVVGTSAGGVLGYVNTTPSAPPPQPGEGAAGAVRGGDPAR
ncbi:hypothetical protein GCM10010174_83660 [Kutzneria viridogrisea]|uniref:WD40 repeat protein n=1 Tax=Kutzneria viridogrisea TaxID=47990 RepID=A0ABR6BEZ0_9PSEU|nr:WD40 repeat protein [Kutzneria viridogrisea]